MFHRHTKAGTICRPVSGGHDSGCPPFFIIFLAIVRFVRQWPQQRQLRQIDTITPFSAEPYYTPSVSTSYTSQTSSGLSFSLADKNASISKVFRLSASAVYLKLGCLVMSYLSERNGRTPRNCKMHLPPSITASSSWLISSLPQCQVMNSKKTSTIQRKTSFMVSAYFVFDSFSCDTFNLGCKKAGDLFGSPT